VQYGDIKPASEHDAVTLLRSAAAAAACKHWLITWCEWVCCAFSLCLYVFRL